MKDKMRMDRFMDNIEKRLSGKGLAHTNSKGDPFLTSRPYCLLSIFSQCLNFFSSKSRTF